MPKINVVTETSRRSRTKRSNREIITSGNVITRFYCTLKDSESPELVAPRCYTISFQVFLFDIKSRQHVSTVGFFYSKAHWTAKFVYYTPSQ